MVNIWENAGKMKDQNWKHLATARKLLRSKTGKNSHDLHDNMVMFFFFKLQVQLPLIQLMSMDEFQFQSFIAIEDPNFECFNS
jgi:hypothetical protein